MRTFRKICLCLFFFVLPAIISAQERAPQGSQPQNQKPDQQPSMPGMDMPNMHHHPGMKMGMEMDHQPSTFIEEIESHAGSGTDAQPDSTPTPMLMTMRGNWMLMLHGVAFLNEAQQSGPRGDDKFFSTNWIMPMAQRKFGSSTLTLRSMLSLEPATVTKRRYPELFQQDRRELR